MPRSKLLETFLLLLLSFLWGSSFTLNEVALQSLPPATLTFGRLLVAAIMLHALVFVLRLPYPKTSSRWAAHIVLGLVQSALPFALISWGQQHIDSGLAGLLNTTPPMFVFLLSFFLIGGVESPAKKLLGIVIGFLGVLIIMGDSALAGEEESVLGQLAVIGASASYAVTAIYARRFSDQSPIVTATCSMTFGAMLLLPFALWFDQPSLLDPNAGSLLAVLFMGIFSTALAMAIYFRLIGTLGPLAVSTGSYLRAAFSVLLGVVLLGETFAPIHAVGLVLIFVSVAIVTGNLKFGALRAQKKADPG